jgi:hypothetical protein
VVLLSRTAGALRILSRSTHAVVTASNEEQEVLAVRVLAGAGVVAAALALASWSEVLLPAAGSDSAPPEQQQQQLQHLRASAAAPRPPCERCHLWAFVSAVPWVLFFQ